MAKFERHFAGRDNAGLRARIRETVQAFDEGRRVGADVGDAIEDLASTVALTAAGRATLGLVAADYREARAGVTYTVRPLGACAWASGIRSLAHARLEAEEARAHGLARVVIVDDRTGETVT